MKYTELKIFKLALNLCKESELVVEGFKRYHKYTIGTDIRKLSKKILYLISKINNEKNQDRIRLQKKLLKNCDKFSILLMLGKDIGVFKSFKQFANLSKFIYEINNQALAWYNYTDARINKNDSLV